MKSILSQLLFEPVPSPAQRGRMVKFDVDELDIMVATGPLDERISALLRMHSYPMTVKEIASGIGSNASQVNKALRLMAANREVDAIYVPGSIKEYTLR